MSRWGGGWGRRASSSQGITPPPPVSLRSTSIHTSTHQRWVVYANGTRAWDLYQFISQKLSVNFRAFCAARQCGDSRRLARHVTGNGRNGKRALKHVKPFRRRKYRTLPLPGERSGVVVRLRDVACLCVNLHATARFLFALTAWMPALPLCENYDSADPGKTIWPQPRFRCNSYVTFV